MDRSAYRPFNGDAPGGTHAMAISRGRPFPMLLLGALTAGAAAGPAWAGPLFPGQDFTIQGTAISVHPGDFDGDGTSDLAVYATNDWLLTVLHGEGGGAYAPWAGPVSLDRVLATGDFDGDGRDDLLAWRRWEIRVCHGDGAGGFGCATAFELPDTEVLRVEPCRLDGDAHLDLVLSGRDGVAHAYRGHGDGTFSETWTFDGTPLGRFELGDFDGDGRDDVLAVTDYEEISTFAGRGDGTFGPAVPSIAPYLSKLLRPADLDSDGILDAVVTNGSDPDLIPWILRGRGDGTFADPEADEDLVPCWVGVSGDWNGDGRADLACAGDQALEIRVRSGTDDGSLGPVSTLPIWLTARTLASLPVDGGDALAIVADSPDRRSNSGRLVVLSASPSIAKFAPIVTRSHEVPASTADGGDVDGDGDVDLVTFQSSFALLWRNDGSGRLGPPERVHFTGSLRSGRLEDIDGDGRLDLIWPSESLPEVAVSLGRGDGTFGETIPTPVGTAFPIYVFDVADLDGDGRKDFAAIAGSWPRQICVFLGNGDGSFRRLDATVSTYGWTGIVAADFDGDGIPDLATADRFSGVATLKGLGGGVFAPEVMIPDSWPAFHVAAADLDDDGVIDLVWTRPELGLAATSLGVGLGTDDGDFRVMPAFPIPTSFDDQIALADWTGDGALDIAISNTSFGGAVLVVPGDGAGGFGRPEAFHGGGLPVAGDFDGDGIVDIATAGTRSRDDQGATVWILLNRRTANRAPSADAGPDRTLECSSSSGAAVRLDGSTSSDPDSTSGTNDDIATWVWTSDAFGTLDGAVVEATLPLGRHVVSLEVTDRGGLSDADDLDVSVVDTSPPSGGIVAPAAGLCFGPASVPVEVEDDFTDACDPALDRAYSPAAPPYASHGDHEITVEARDGSGNAASGTASFTIDLVAPVASIATPSGGWTVPGAVPLRLVLASADADGAAGDVVRETLSLSDCLLLDGAVDGDRDGLLSDETASLDLAALCAAATRCKWTVLESPTLRFEATDCGGNVGPATHSWPGPWKLRPGMCGP